MEKQFLYVNQMENIFLVKKVNFLGILLKII